jgi:cysteine synthase A
VPDVYRTDLIDEVIQVSKDEAFEYAREIAKKEGILVGISTGASLAAVAKKQLPYQMMLRF